MPGPERGWNRQGAERQCCQYSKAEKMGSSAGPRSQRAFEDVANVWILLPEMQIKTTVRYHITPVRKAITKEIRGNKIW